VSIALGRPGYASSLRESDKVRRARGHAERPLSELELFDKFRTCLDSGHARLSPERLFDRLRGLENVTARELTAVLQTA
jgi:hypothetical protein